jgi:hypothetical protein
MKTFSEWLVENKKDLFGDNVPTNLFGDELNNRKKKPSPTKPKPKPQQGLFDKKEPELFDKEEK